MMWAETLAWLGIGYVVGAVCGWTLRTMVYAREARDRIRHVEDEMGGESGQVTNRVAIAAVIVIMAVSVGLSAYNADRTADVARDNEANAQCQQRLLQQTITGLNQRTADSDETARAQQRVRNALAEIVSASLPENEPSEGEARAIVAELGDSLAEADRLERRVKRKRDRYEYPSPEQITNCPPVRDE